MSEPSAVTKPSAQGGEKTVHTGLNRTLEIARFLLKYRNSGVFTGIDAAAKAGVESFQVDPGTAEHFAADVEALGTTFIKIGQSLSTRPDLVPPEFRAALESLQDGVKPIAFDQIREVIEADLGVKLGRIFASFDEAPLGCASMAQVHAATLRDGREVAVKVQRPGASAQIEADLEVLAGMAVRVDGATEIGRRLQFADWVHEFARTLREELDFRIEADNLERFGGHLAAYPELCVPKPLRDFTGERVLTMERIHGVRVTDVGGLRRTEQDFEPVVAALMRGYLDQIFVHGEIHADPHPGNLLLMPDGRLAIFDLGMLAHVPPGQRERLLKLLIAAVEGRGEEVARETIELGTRMEDFDRQRYVRDVSQMVGRYAARAGGESLAEGDLMLEIVRVATSHGLRTPAELSLLGRTLSHLEAVCRALDPSLDVKRVVESHLDTIMRQRTRQALSWGNLASELMELQSLAREAPRKITDILSLLADNRMQVRVTGLEESRLMENLQKIANRVSAGLITAALIVASALLMRIDAGPKLLAYPALALILFLAAFTLGGGIVVSAMLRDRKARPREERGPR